MRFILYTFMLLTVTWNLHSYSPTIRSIMLLSSRLAVNPFTDTLNLLENPVYIHPSIVCFVYSSIHQFLQPHIHLPNCSSNDSSLLTYIVIIFATQYFPHITLHGPFPPPSPSPVHPGKSQPTNFQAPNLPPTQVIFHLLQNWSRGQTPHAELLDPETRSRLWNRSIYLHQVNLEVISLSQHTEKDEV